MAEFVSAIFGLVAAGAKVGSSLYALIDTLKDAPNEFLALSDEVTDFRQVLTKVIEMRNSGELCLNGGYPDDSIAIALERGRKLLEKVDKLVQKVIKEHGKTQNTKVNRIEWLKRVKKANKLQIALRVQKSFLCNIITIDTLYVS